MDVNTARAAITVLAFVAFLGIVYWAYTSRNRKRFDEAANLPFDDEDIARRSRINRKTDSGNSSNG